MGFTDAQLRMVELAVQAGIAEAMKGIETRMGETRDEIVAINTRLSEGDATMKQLATDLKANSTSTANVLSSTEEMRSMFETAKKGFAFIGGIGTAAKWLMTVIGPIYGLYLFGKGVLSGHPPPPTK